MICTLPNCPWAHDLRIRGYIEGSLETYAFVSTLTVCDTVLWQTLPLNL